jgi:hypothetical protein
VNFIGTDGHVHELYIKSGVTWANNDLTAMSGGGIPPVAGSALDGYWGSDGSQHVNFIGTDGHVHELYIKSGVTWANNDLTNVQQAHVTTTLQSITGVTSADLAPIVALELDLVGYDNGHSTVLSSGAGTITYTASSLLTVLSQEPVCTQGDVVTEETANSFYGELSAGPSNTFTQSFSEGAAELMIRKVGKFHRLPPRK